MRDIVGLWVARVDGMIHPEAAFDPFLAPLHRSFLISSFVSGAVALIVMPLHLALAGPPHAAVLLVLAWMVSQWPLALYLSRSGALNKAIGLSSMLFACLVTAVCLLTGGLSSFALPWLLVPVIETAFATNRKTPVLATGLCAALLGLLALAPPPGFQLAVPDGNVPLYTVLGALLYGGILCFRLSLDRVWAQGAVGRSQAQFERIAQGSTDVVCDLADDGSVRVLGGAVGSLLGGLPYGDGEDWVFPRLHVADRPLYLTRVSDARRSGETQVFTVRFRVGASQPGEEGLPEYRSLQLTVQRPVSVAAGADAKLILTLSAGVDDVVEAVADTTPLGSGAEVRLQRAADITELPGGEVPDSIPGMPGRVGPVHGTTPGENANGAIAARRSTGAAAVAEGEQPAHLAIDVAACLEQCRDLLAPVAARRGVLLDLAAGDDLPPVAIAPKSVRQALYFLLADMIETSGEGALLTVSAEVQAVDLDCVLTVRNRASGLPWCADGSETVFESASALLEEGGGRLSVRPVPGRGDCVVVHLPLCPRAVAANPLAKTA